MGIVGETDGSKMIVTQVDLAQDGSVVQIQFSYESQHVTAEALAEFVANFETALRGKRSSTTNGSALYTISREEKESQLKDLQKYFQDHRDEMKGDSDG